MQMYHDLDRLRSRSWYREERSSHFDGAGRVRQSLAVAASVRTGQSHGHGSRGRGITINHHD